MTSKSYYDLVIDAGDREDYLTSSYDEESEQWVLWNHRYNSPAKKLNIEFDTEEEAEDYIFEKIEDFDLQESNTAWYNKLT